MQPGVRMISGRYRGTFPGGEVELRVDVFDGPRPTNRVSGDFFQVTGGTKLLEASFIVDAPLIPPGDAEIVIEGAARFSSDLGASRVRVIVPRIFPMPQAIFATLQVLTANGAVQREVTCAFESGFFRTVELKQDAERGLDLFSSYLTGDLLSGGPSRTLDIRRAYEEAGIEVIPSAEAPSPLEIKAPGSDKSWSSAELHEAMQRNFKGLETVPVWKVWFLHARKYEVDGTLGLMFDVQGRQRQGCAMFYRVVGGQDRLKRREQLHTCIHEIGHCLNLEDAFVSSPVTGLPTRPGALSWMNYPSKYTPGGADAYWPAFSFQFEEAELIHLRHGFFDDVVPGGRPFEGTGALRLHRHFREPVEDRSGLQLRLEAPSALDFGEPVWVELRLSLQGEEPKEVHPYLHPREGCVHLSIEKPGGETVLFQPLFRHYVEPRTVVLDEESPALYESTFLGFGKPGFYFAQPGLYRIRAFYVALDGSQIVSNPLALRIRSPFSREDDEVAELFLGEEQGKLIAFRGSDGLPDGNRALNRVIRDYGDHALASYARMVQGYNLAREFKTPEPDGEVYLRPSDPQRAQEILRPMIDDFVSGRSQINNLTFRGAMRRLAKGQSEAKDRKGAKATLEKLEDQLCQRRRARYEEPFKPYVLRAIQNEVSEALRTV
jgi:hypothetical protein